MLAVIARELHYGTIDDQAAAQRIRFIVKHMWRRRAVRTTKPRSPPLTPALRARIRALARTTDLSQMQIGLRAGVNSGRVSETLAGKRR